MNNITKQLISLLANSKKARYVLKDYLKVNTEVHMYFEPTGTKLHPSVKAFNYIVTEEAFAEINWNEVKQGMGYDVNI